MLQNIRDRLSGPIVWFVIGLICIPFAFWGIESFKGGSTDPVVAKVGDHEITQAEFRQGYDQRYQQLQQMLGESFKPGMIDQARFRKNVLDDMVQEQVLRQYSHEAGYRASDAAVFNYLSSVPAFQENGKFSAQIYRDLLARRGLQPQRFEGDLRQSLVIDQLRESISDSAFVSEEEAQITRRISGQTRDIGMAVLPIARFQKDVQVTDAQIAARYEENKANYMAPERLKLAYVDLDLDKLPKAENPGADVLKVAYDAEKDSRFTGTEERRASHILIAFGADKSAAKAKIEKIQAELKGGAGFAEEAKKNSDDPGSKTQGGDLGWVKRGMMTKSFEDALFALKSGETSDVVETEFGYHLIKLDELKAPAARAFDDPSVQAELLELYQQREAQKRFQETSDKLEQLAFESPTSLDGVAQTLGLKVETTDWFTRAGGPGILAQEAVKTAAFSPEVLNDNENSKPLSVGPGRVVVIRKSEYEAPRQRPQNEVADGIREELKLAAAKTQAAAKSRELLAALRKGDSLDAASAAAGAEMHADANVTRSGNTPERAVIDAAFKLPRPADGKPSAGEVTLANGDLAVILLRKIDEPSGNPGTAQREVAQLREAVAGAEYAAMRKSLEKNIKVKIENAPADDNAAAPAPDSGG
ncbi:SurA N-terminal domain-containing protein [Hydrocarboniphaga sp.]|uniref:SurA N-terminal domain-containing protein n=1 Tax=Hydrocarboniphaga sp. TaxID=2033016 RepID=UPI003D0AFD5E